MVADGKIKRLIIEEPPRHGKSELVSRRLPAYILGKNPNAKIIATSYAHSLAASMNRDVQRIMDSSTYQAIFPKTRLSGKNVKTSSRSSWLRNSEEFEVVDAEGSYKCAGVCGGITGKGFDFGFIDDPYKDEKEASSPVVQQAVWEWYTSTFFTRQEKDAAIVITLTRWNMKDLVSLILQQEREQGTDSEWTILRLPAIAEGVLHPDDPRQEGEALWSEKYDIAKLLQMKRTMPISQWSAMYQQEPVPKTGRIFNLAWIKQEHKVNVLPAQLKTLWYWDNAGTEDGGARTCGALVGKADGLYYIIKIIKGQWSAATRESVKLHNANMAREKYGTQVVYCEQEPGSGGLEQFEATQRFLDGFAVYKDKVTGDKAERAKPFASQLEVGNVRFLDDPDDRWLNSFLDELYMFPNGRFKDQVDAVSGAIAKLAATKAEGKFEKWL